MEIMLGHVDVKYNLKRCGIGSALLKTVEQHAIQHGKTSAIVHLGNQDDWESRLFYPAQGYSFLLEDYMGKELMP